MEQAPQRLFLGQGPDCIRQNGGGCGIRAGHQVEGHQEAAHAPGLELFEPVPDIRRRGPRRATDEQQRAGPPLGQPVDQAQANAAQGARNEIGGLGSNRQGCGPLALAHNNLAPVPGLGQEPKGVRHGRDREHLDGDGLEGALLEFSEEVDEQLAHQLGFGGGHLQQVEGQVGRIGASLLGLGPAPDLNLAQLDEAPAWS